MPPKGKMQNRISSTQGKGLVPAFFFSFFVNIELVLPAGKQEGTPARRVRDPEQVFFQPVHFRMLGICGILSKGSEKDVLNEIIVSTHQFPCHCSHTSSGKLSSRC